MSEQTIQDGLYSIPVQMDKYVCRSLGAATIKDLVKNKEISGLTIRECNGIKANKPDVLVLNKNKEIVIFIEMKKPSEQEYCKICRYLLLKIHYTHLLRCSLLSFFPI